MKYSLVILLVCFSVGVLSAQKKSKRLIEKFVHLKMEVFHAQVGVNSIYLQICHSLAYVCPLNKIVLNNLIPKIELKEKQNEAYKLLVYNQPDIKAFNYINDFYLYNINRK